MAKGTDEGPAAIESLQIKVGEHQAHYLKTGSGAPVVLIHGGASDSRDWTGTMSSLSHHYSLYAPDLIGYGQSDRRQEGYYISEFSDFILGFMETLGLERPVLVGHSFGGRLCLEIALQHPERVRKLVLIDAAGLGKISRLGNGIHLAFWVIRRVFGIRQPFPTFLTREGEDTSWLCLDRLPGLRVPTLLIWKRHDPYFPVGIARRARSLIPGSSLVVLPGYGHAPHGEAGDSFNRLLLDFMDHD